MKVIVLVIFSIVAVTVSTAATVNRKTRAAYDEDDGQYHANVGEDDGQYHEDHSGDYHSDGSGQYVNEPVDSGVPYVHTGSKVEPYKHIKDQLVPYIPYKDSGYYSQNLDNGNYKYVGDEGAYKQTPDSGGYKQSPDSGSYKQTPDSGSYKQTPDSGSYNYKQKPDSGGYKQTPDSGGYEETPDSGSYNYKQIPFSGSYLPTGDKSLTGYDDGQYHPDNNKGEKYSVKYNEDSSQYGSIAGNVVSPTFKPSSIFAVAQNSVRGNFGQNQAGLSASSQNGNVFSGFKSVGQSSSNNVIGQNAASSYRNVDQSKVDDGQYRPDINENNNQGSSVGQHSGKYSFSSVSQPGRSSLFGVTQNNALGNFGQNQFNSKAFGATGTGYSASKDVSQSGSFSSNGFSSQNVGTTSRNNVVGQNVASQYRNVDQTREDDGQYHPDNNENTNQGSSGVQNSQKYSSFSSVSQTGISGPTGVAQNSVRGNFGQNQAGLSASSQNGNVFSVFKSVGQSSSNNVIGQNAASSYRNVDQSKVDDGQYRPDINENNNQGSSVGQHSGKYSFSSVSQAGRSSPFGVTQNNGHGNFGQNQLNSKAFGATGTGYSASKDVGQSGSFSSNGFSSQNVGTTSRNNVVGQNVASQHRNVDQTREDDGQYHPDYNENTNQGSSGVQNSQKYSSFSSVSQTGISGPTGVAQNNVRGSIEQNQPRSSFGQTGSGYSVYKSVGQSGSSSFPGFGRANEGITLHSNVIGQNVVNKNKENNGQYQYDRNNNNQGSSVGQQSGKYSFSSVSQTGRSSPFDVTQTVAHGNFGENQLNSKLSGSTGTGYSASNYVGQSRSSTNGFSSQNVVDQTREDDGQYHADNNENTNQGSSGVHSSEKHSSFSSISQTGRASPTGVSQNTGNSFSIAKSIDLSDKYSFPGSSRANEGTRVDDGQYHADKNENTNQGPSGVQNSEKHSSFSSISQTGRSSQIGVTPNNVRDNNNQGSSIGHQSGKYSFSSVSQTGRSSPFEVSQNNAQGNFGQNQLHSKVSGATGTGYSAFNSVGQSGRNVDQTKVDDGQYHGDNYENTNQGSSGVQNSEKPSFSSISQTGRSSPIGVTQNKVLDNNNQGSSVGQQSGKYSFSSVSQTGRSSPFQVSQTNAQGNFGQNQLNSKVSGATGTGYSAFNSVGQTGRNVDQTKVDDGQYHADINENTNQGSSGVQNSEKHSSFSSISQTGRSSPIGVTQNKVLDNNNQGSSVGQQSGKYSFSSVSQIGRSSPFEVSQTNAQGNFLQNQLNSKVSGATETGYSAFNSVGQSGRNVDQTKVDDGQYHADINENTNQGSSGVQNSEKHFSFSSISQTGRSSPIGVTQNKVLDNNNQGSSVGQQSGKYSFSSVSQIGRSSPFEVSQNNVQGNFGQNQLNSKVSGAAGTGYSAFNSVGQSGSSSINGFSSQNAGKTSHNKIIGENVASLYRNVDQTKEDDGQYHADKNENTNQGSSGVQNSEKHSSFSSISQTGRSSPIGVTQNKVLDNNNQGASVGQQSGKYFFSSVSQTGRSSPIAISQNNAQGNFGQNQLNSKVSGATGTGYSAFNSVSQSGRNVDQTKVDDGQYHADINENTNQDSSGVQNSEKHSSFSSISQTGRSSPIGVTQNKVLDNNNQGSSVGQQSGKYSFSSVSQTGRSSPFEVSQTNAQANFGQNQLNSKVSGATGTGYSAFNSIGQTGRNVDQTKVDDGQYHGDNNENTNQGSSGVQNSEKHFSFTSISQTGRSSPIGVTQNKVLYNNNPGSPVGQQSGKYSFSSVSQTGRSSPFEVSQTNAKGIYGQNQLNSKVSGATGTGYSAFNSVSQSGRNVDQTKVDDGQYHADKKENTNQGSSGVQNSEKHSSFSSVSQTGRSSPIGVTQNKVLDNNNQGSSVGQQSGKYSFSSVSQTGSQNIGTNLNNNVASPYRNVDQTREDDGQYHGDKNENSNQASSGVQNSEKYSSFSSVSQTGRSSPFGVTQNNVHSNIGQNEYNNQGSSVGQHSGKYSFSSVSQTGNDSPFKLAQIKVFSIEGQNQGIAPAVRSFGQSKNEYSVYKSFGSNSGSSGLNNLNFGTSNLIGQNEGVKQTGTFASASSNKITNFGLNDKKNLHSSLQSTLSSTYGQLNGHLDESHFGCITKTEEFNDDGYHYVYETENGIVAEEEGKLVGKGTENVHLEVKGFYSYRDPNNVINTVEYTADSTNGFVPKFSKVDKSGILPKNAGHLFKILNN